MKWKVSFLVLVLIIGFGLHSSCASSDSAKLVKTYQDGLAPLVGKTAEDVTKTIAFSWKFGILDRWEAVDPSLETVMKKNFAKRGFSKQEAQEIFAEKGTYQAMLFQKVVGQAEANVETQVGMTMTGMNQSSTSEEFSHIRVVFKDNKLVYYRVW
jgi:hypothetical protein